MAQITEQYLLLDEMNKKQFKKILENGMTVEELINKLQKFDKKLIVINSRDKNKLPIDSVEESQIDYCYDEIIRQKVVSIW